MEVLVEFAALILLILAVLTLNIKTHGVKSGTIVTLLTFTIGLAFILVVEIVGEWAILIIAIILLVLALFFL